MKKKLIILAIAIIAIVLVLAYFKYVPFWGSIISTIAFIVGFIGGWYFKGWRDKHIKSKSVI